MKLQPWQKVALSLAGAVIFVVWGYLMLHVWKWFFLTTTRDLPPILPF